MLIYIYKHSDVKYTDIQRIGASICEIESCIGGIEPKEIEMLNEIYERFDIKLEKLKNKKG